jgi:23S rRNA (adenine2503-C2)-methyltransferase
MAPSETAAGVKLMTKDLKSMTLEELQGLAAGMGQKAFAGGYIFSFIQQKGADGIEDITPLSKAFRQKLSGEYSISNLTLVSRFEDPDKTVKYLFELPGGGRIESVALFDEGRKTLCISTQSGCSRKCEFCATGYLKFRRNLTAGEIVDQVIKASKDIGRISNVVYMGMGEPLDNYQEVLRSVRILNAAEGLNIGIRHITISTCGIVSGIRKLADEGLGLRLAISLHATDDVMRAGIMPGIGKENLADLLAAVRYYQQKTRQRVTFEYIMIKGLNDSNPYARRLAKLIEPLKANVNIIEYNPHPHSHFVPSDRKTIRQFRDILVASGIETVIRFKRGQAIKAACGQLGSDWLE